MHKSMKGCNLLYKTILARVWLAWARGHQPFWNRELLLGTDLCERLPVWYPHFWNKHLFNLSSIMLSLIKIKDICQCEDADHVYVIFRTSPWVTHMARTGDLVPAYTMLVIPGSHCQCCTNDSLKLLHNTLAYIWTVFIWQQRTHHPQSSNSSHSQTSVLRSITFA